MAVTDPPTVEVKEVPFSGQPKPLVRPDAISLSEDALDAYVGIYYLPPVTIRIASAGDHLQHIEADSSVFDNLYPESRDLFFYENWDRKVQFGRDDDGRVTRYFLICKGVRQEARRID